MGYVSTPAGQVVGVIPDANEDPNLPADLLAIAKALEKRVLGVYPTTAARDTATAAAGLEAGMFAVTKDTTPFKVWYYSGTAWVAFPPAQPAITSGTSVPSNATGANGDIYFKV
jgi:hypothetical protein